MPYIAGVLNFAWEVCALYNSKGFWGHCLWFLLDLFIVFFSYNFIKSKIQKRIYIFSILISVIILFFVFKLQSGMLYSVFIIDIIMAICFIVYHKQLSPYFKIQIAIFKLIGDTFAGLYYTSESKFIALIAVMVFICNVVYLVLCVNEYVKLGKEQYYKRFESKLKKKHKNNNVNKKRR